MRTVCRADLIDSGLATFKQTDLNDPHIKFGLIQMCRTKQTIQRSKNRVEPLHSREEAERGFQGLYWKVPPRQPYDNNMLCAVSLFILLCSWWCNSSAVQVSLKIRVAQLNHELWAGAWGFSKNQTVRPYRAAFLIHQSAVLRSRRQPLQRQRGNDSTSSTATRHDVLLHWVTITLTVLCPITEENFDILGNNLIFWDWKQLVWLQSIQR